MAALKFGKRAEPVAEAAPSLSFGSAAPSTPGRKATASKPSSRKGGAAKAVAEEGPSLSFGSAAPASTPGRKKGGTTKGAAPCVKPAKPRLEPKALPAAAEPAPRVKRHDKAAAKASAKAERRAAKALRPKQPPRAAAVVRVEDGFNDPDRPVCSPFAKAVGGVSALWLLIYLLTATVRGRGASSHPSGVITFRGEGGVLYGNDEPFLIKGANWFGSEAFNGPLGGLDVHGIGWYMAFLKKHNFNAVRLLFNHESVLRDEIVEAPKQEARLFQVRYLEMFAVLAREAARES